MKNLLSALLVFSFLFTIGCEDDEATDDATEPNPLVGVYNMVSYAISGVDSVNADANNSLVMILADSSIFSIQGILDGESDSYSGTWSSNGNTLTINYFTEVGQGVSDLWYYTLIRYFGDQSYWSYTLSGDDMSMSTTYISGYYDESLTITYNWEKE
ncbi:uncharacterized protein METZ01_LOCUS220385 [marine metagenome]|uniref:Lipocalin-like domain-containing protein n=1 Tax=marine metagenome TaxID=408172 RepID=A0A382G021_9ZZZZ|tara:strand:- start:51 stop:521 length:471 start_codon:yes stop_codon:yes gene_type:complete